MSQPHLSATSLLAEKLSHLRYFEKVAARYGYKDRFDILLQIDILRQEIVVLEQTVHTIAVHPPSNGDSLVSPPRQGHISPAEREALTQRIITNLIKTQQALDQVTSELGYLPESAQTVARNLIDQAQRDHIHITKAWQEFQTDRRVPQQALRAFLEEILQTQAKLQLLERRQMYRRAFSIMEQQRAAHQFMLPVGDLRKSIELSIAEEQRAITALEQKMFITAHDVALLAIHRENLTWYQEIIAGHRPWISIGLCRQIQSTVAAIKAIDDQLESGYQYLKRVTARYEFKDPFDILPQIQVLRQEIAELEHEPLTQRIITNLTKMQQALNEVTSELGYLPESAQSAARNLIDQAQRDHIRTTQAWQELAAVRRTPQHVLRALLEEIWQSQAKLQLLERRQIYRKTLSIMEQQRAAHQVMLPVGDLGKSIGQSIAEEQRAITALEQKMFITAHDVALLAIHRENLSWYREMITGQRPWIPVELLRQIQSTVAAIKAIDDQIERDYRMFTK